MRIPSRFTAGVFAFLAAAPTTSAAVIDVDVTPLVVRLYGPPVVSSSDSRSALEEAKTILAHAGFAPEWITCAEGLPAPQRCTVPLAGAELAVRLATAPPQARSNRSLPLGYSLVDPETQSGALATIYLDRVKWLADVSTAHVATLLGRAIAHELGHLLLGTPEHGRFGVMRAIWSSQMVRNSARADWRFSAREAKQMRAAVTARATAGQLAQATIR
jgi:hypothetical protein